MDASVFLYAYLRPIKKPPMNVEAMKRSAHSIVKRIVDGEIVATTLIHVSEIANILEARMPLTETLDILASLLALPSLRVLEPSRRLYEAAIEEARALSIGVNDSLARLAMVEQGITEVYSFDTDFDKLDSVRRITE